MTDGLAAFALLAWLAYLASRVLARRNLPELVGFLLVGALLGPSGVELISSDELLRLQPITEIALAVLMFVIGERASSRALKAARWSLTVGVLQFVLSAVGVFFAAEAVGADRSVALLLAALAGAGAPLTISHVVASAKVSTSYTRGLISTHAVSDAIATTVFAAVLPVATLLADTDADIGQAVLDFIQLGVGGVVAGVLGGLFIARLGPQIETSGELLLFVGVHLLLGWAATQAIDISLPLAALVAGATASSVSPASFTQRLFRTIKSIEQPLYLLFFALAGAAIHLSDLPGVGVLGVVYIAVRVAAKLVGAAIGGPLGGLKWRDSLRLGVDLTPQAGVAVGLAVLASEAVPDAGAEAATVILGSVVLFELIGPILVVRNLGAHKRNEEQAGVVDESPDLDEVPEVILVAAPRVVDIPEWIITSAGRWRARIVMLQPGFDDDDHVERVVRLTGEVSIQFDFERLDSESFTGAVVRAQATHDADLVVVFGERGSGSSSRLSLSPAERIARQLDCPVLIFPLATPADWVEPSPSSRFWPFSG